MNKKEIFEQFIFNQLLTSGRQNARTPDLFVIKLIIGRSIKWFLSVSNLDSDYWGIGCVIC